MLIEIMERIINLFLQGSQHSMWQNTLFMAPSSQLYLKFGAGINKMERLQIQTYELTMRKEDVKALDRKLEAV